MANVLKMRAHFFVLALLVANLTGGSSANASICIQRVKAYALLIGNNDYVYLPKLANAKNDVEAVQRALDTRGFIVRTRLDFTVNEIPEFLEHVGQSFCERANVGLIYFAGSAVEIDGRPYLVPVDYKVPDLSKNMSPELAVRSGLLPLDELVKAFSKTAAKAVYVVIDGCRDDPFVPKTADRSPGNTIESVFSPLSAVKVVAFSDESGGFPVDGLTPESKNSPFAEAFVKALESDMADFDSVLARVRQDVISATNGKQRPDWYRASGAGRTGADLLAGPPKTSLAIER